MTDADSIWDYCVNGLDHQLPEDTDPSMVHFAHIVRAIAKNMNKNLMFWIKNLIKTIEVDIISNNTSLKRTLLVAVPLTYAIKAMPKSSKRLRGVVKMRKETSRIAMNGHIKVSLRKKNKPIDPKINEIIVTKNKTINWKISSTWPTSFSLSCSKKNLK